MDSKVETSEVWDILQNSWDKDFVSHFEGEMKRKGNGLKGLILPRRYILLICEQ